MGESTTTTTEVQPEGYGLGQLIAKLEQANPDQRVRLGFTNPHSYRGYYDELAFEPKRDTTVREMLAEARSAMGRTFHGYKGGEYHMGEHSPCWLAYYGATGETLGAVMLSFMLESFESSPLALRNAFKAGYEAAQEDFDPVIHGLMEIAETAMPDSYFARDSRVVAARAALGEPSDGG